MLDDLFCGSLTLSSCYRLLLTLGGFLCWKLKPSLLWQSVLDACRAAGASSRRAEILHRWLPLRGRYLYLRAPQMSSSGGFVTIFEPC